MLSDRAEATKLLAQRLPLNSLGLPEGLYRPDLLVNYYNDQPEHSPSSDAAATTDIIISNGSIIDTDNTNGSANEEIPSPHNGGSHTGELATLVDSADSALRTLGFDPDHIDVAYKKLSYIEGFPAFDDGTPFWEQMDSESNDAHLAFKTYLSQVRNGARQLFLLPIALPKDAQHVTMLELKEFYYLHYWSFRAKAFDMYAEVVRRKQMERRALDTQDYHFFESQKLMNQVLLKMRPVETGQTDGEGNPIFSDFWEDISPKVLVDLLKTLVSIQRISTGLPSAGPPAPNQAGRDSSPFSAGSSNGSSLEILLKTVAKESGAVTLDRDGNPLTGQSSGADDGALEQALKDPETAGMIQELVIKMSNHG